MSFMRSLKLVSISVFTLLVASLNLNAQPEPEPVSYEFEHHDYCPEIYNNPDDPTEVGMPGIALTIMQPADADKPLPVIVFFQGYGYNINRSQDGNYDNDNLTMQIAQRERGFIAVFVRYPEPHAKDADPLARYWDMSGYDFPHKLRYVDYGACAIRWLRAHSRYKPDYSDLAPPEGEVGTFPRYYIDPNRIGAAGHSTGGMITAYLSMVDRDPVPNGTSDYEDLVQSVDSIVAANLGDQFKELQEYSLGSDGIPGTGDEMDISVSDSSANDYWKFYPDGDPISSRIQGAVIANAHADWLSVLTRCRLTASSVKNYQDANLGPIDDTNVDGYPLCFATSNADKLTGYNAAASVKLLEQNFGSFFGDLVEDTSVNPVAEAYFDALSPVNKVNADYRPATMFVVGAKDKTVSPESSLTSARYIKALTNDQAIVKTLIHTNDGHNPSLSQLSTWIDFFDVIFTGADTVPKDSVQFEKAFYRRFGAKELEIPNVPKIPTTLNSNEYFCNYDPLRVSHHHYDNYFWVQSDSYHDQDRECDVAGTNEPLTIVSLDEKEILLEDYVDTSSEPVEPDLLQTRSLQSIRYLHDYILQQQLPAAFPDAKTCVPSVSPSVCEWTLCSEGVTDCENSNVKVSMTIDDELEGDLTQQRRFRTEISLNGYNKDGMTLTGTIVEYHDRAGNGFQTTSAAGGGRYLQFNDANTSLDLSVEINAYTIFDKYAAGNISVCSQSDCSSLDAEGQAISTYAFSAGLPSWEALDNMESDEPPLMGYMIQNVYNGGCLTRTDNAEYVYAGEDLTKLVPAYSYDNSSNNTSQLTITKTCDVKDENQRWLVDLDEGARSTIKGIDQENGIADDQQCLRSILPAAVNPYGALQAFFGTSSCNYSISGNDDTVFTLTQTGIDAYSFGPLYGYGASGQIVETELGTCVEAYSAGTANITLPISNLITSFQNSSVSGSEVNSVTGSVINNCFARFTPADIIAKSFRWRFYLQNDLQTPIDPANPPYLPLGFESIATGVDWKVIVDGPSDVLYQSDSATFSARVIDLANGGLVTTGITLNATHYDKNGAASEIFEVDGQSLTIPTLKAGYYRVVAKYDTEEIDEYDERIFIESKPTDFTVFDAFTDSDADGLNDFWEYKTYGNLDALAAGVFTGDSSQSNKQAHDLELIDEAVLYGSISYFERAKQLLKELKSSASCQPTTQSSCQWFLCATPSIVDPAQCTSQGSIRWISQIPNPRDSVRIENTIEFNGYVIDGIAITGTVVFNGDINANGRYSTTAPPVPVQIDGQPRFPGTIATTLTVYDNTGIRIGEVNLNQYTVEDKPSGGWIARDKCTNSSCEGAFAAFTLPYMGTIGTSVSSSELDTYRPLPGYLIKHSESQPPLCIGRSSERLEGLETFGELMIAAECKVSDQSQRWMVLPQDPDNLNETLPSIYATIEDATDDSSNLCAHYNFWPILPPSTNFFTSPCERADVEPLLFDPTMLFTFIEPLSASELAHKVVFGPVLSIVGDETLQAQSDEDGFVCAGIDETNGTKYIGSGSVFSPANCNQRDPIDSRYHWTTHLMDNLEYSVDLRSPPYDVNRINQIISGAKGTFSIVAQLDLQQPEYLNVEPFVSDLVGSLTFTGDAFDTNGTASLADEIDWHIEHVSVSGEVTEKIVLDAPEYTINDVEQGSYTITANVSDSYYNPLIDIVSFEVHNPFDYDGDELFDEWEVLNGFDPTVPVDENISQAQFTGYQTQSYEYAALKEVLPTLNNCDLASGTCQVVLCDDQQVHANVDECSNASQYIRYTYGHTNPEDTQRVETIVEYVNYPMNGIKLNGVSSRQGDVSGNGRHTTVPEHSTRTLINGSPYDYPPLTALELSNEDGLIASIDYEIYLTKYRNTGGYISITPVVGDKVVIDAQSQIEYPGEIDTEKFRPKYGYVIRRSDDDSACITHSSDDSYGLTDIYGKSQGSNSVHALPCIWPDAGEPLDNQRWSLEVSESSSMIITARYPENSEIEECFHFSSISGNVFATARCDYDGNTVKPFNPSMYFTHLDNNQFAFGPETRWNGIGSQAVTTTYNGVCVQVAENDTVLKTPLGYNCANRAQPIDTKLQWEFFLQNDFDTAVDVFDPPYKPEIFEELVNGRSGLISISVVDIPYTTVDFSNGLSGKVVEVGQSISLTATAIGVNGDERDAAEPGREFVWSWARYADSSVSQLLESEEVVGSASLDLIAEPGFYRISVKFLDSYLKDSVSQEVTFAVSQKTDVDGDGLDNEWEIENGFLPNSLEDLKNRSVEERIMLRTLSYASVLQQNMAEVFYGATACDPSIEECEWRLCENGSILQMLNGNLPSCNSGEGSLVITRVLAKPADADRFETLYEFHDFPINSTSITGHAIAHTNANGVGRLSSLAEPQSYLQGDIEQYNFFYPVEPLIVSDPLGQSASLDIELYLLAFKRSDDAMQSTPTAGFVSISCLDGSCGLDGEKEYLSVAKLATISKEQSELQRPVDGYAIKNISADICIATSSTAVEKVAGVPREGVFMARANGCGTGSNYASQRWQVRQSGDGSEKRITSALDPNPDDGQCLQYSYAADGLFTDGSVFVTEACDRPGYSGSIEFSMSVSMAFEEIHDGLFAFGPKEHLDSGSGSYPDVCAQFDQNSWNIISGNWIFPRNCNMDGATQTSDKEWAFYLLDDKSHPIDIYNPPYKLGELEYIIDGVGASGTNQDGDNDTPNPQDSDGDGMLDIEDWDDDGDGVPDILDGHNLYDSLEYLDAFAKLAGWMDADGDGIVDNDGTGEYTGEIPLVGKIPASFSVSPQGSARYSVPLQLVPSTNGLQPMVSLEYDNNSKADGVMGLSWSLAAGDSMIYRCPLTRREDGVSDPVDFDDNDRFCMGGQRLYLQTNTGDYGSNDSIYTVRSNPLQKIKRVLASDSDEFIIYRQDGRIETLEAYQTNSSGTAYNWRTVEVSDSYNQDTGTMQYVYEESAAHTGGILKSVTYAGGKVEFDYVDHENPMEGYVAPAVPFERKKRLSKIKIFVSNTPFANLLRTYSLEYTWRDGKKVLGTIKSCDTDDKCLLPLNFIWGGSRLDKPHSHYELEESDYPNVLISDSINSLGAYFADMNADGVLDIMQIYDPDEKTDYFNGEANRAVTLSKLVDIDPQISSSNSAKPDWLFGGSKVFSPVGDDSSAFDLSDVIQGKPEGTRVQDINGDGKADIVVMYTPNNGEDPTILPSCYDVDAVCAVWINDGDTLEYSLTYTDSLWESAVFLDRGASLIDIDGNGYPDVVQAYHSGEEFEGKYAVYLNDGSRFSYSAGFTDSLAATRTYLVSSAGPKPLFEFGEQTIYTTEADMGTRLVDINNDGLVDIIQLFATLTDNHKLWTQDIPPEEATEDDLIRKVVFLNTGEGFKLSETYTNSLQDSRVLFRGSSLDQNTRMGDFNGDGYLDLLRLSIDGDGDSVRELYLNNGEEFVPVESFAQNTPELTFSFAPSNGDAGFRLADINLDGRTDLIQIYVHYSSLDQVSTSRESPAEILRAVYLSTGDGFEYSQYYTDALPNSPYLAFTLGIDVSLNTVNSTLTFSPGLQMLDITGDGTLEFFAIVAPDGDSPSTEWKRLKMSMLPQSQGITMFRNGVDVTLVDYEDQNLHQQGSSSFTPIYSPAEEYGEQEGPALGNRHLVKSVSRFDGNSGVNRFSYKYFEGKVNYDIGSALGFKTVEMTDEQTGFTSSTTYSQDYAAGTLGLVERSTVTTASGIVLKSLTNEFNTMSVDSGVYQWPYIETTTTVSTDLDGSDLGTAVTTVAYSEPGLIYSVDKEYMLSDQPVESPVVDYVERTEFEFHPETYRPSVKHRLLKYKKYFGTRKPELTYSENDFVVTSYEYNSNGLKEDVVLQDSSYYSEGEDNISVTTTYTYDENGRVYTVTLSGDDITDQVTTYNYNTQGRLGTIENALGQLTSYSYLSTQNSKHSWLPTKIEDNNGIEVSATYDSFGMVNSQKDDYGFGSEINKQWCGFETNIVCQKGEVFYALVTNDGGSDETQFFDSLGRLRRSTSYVYDSQYPQGRVVEQIRRYDDKGRLVWISTPYFENDTSSSKDDGERYEYDDLDRVVAVKLYDGDELKTSRSVTYSGLTTTVTDTEQKTKTITKNLIGQVVSVKDHDNKVMGYTYDIFGNYDTITDSKTNVTDLDFDKRQRLRHSSDPDRGSITRTYYASGLLKTETDANNIITEYQYDILGRPDFMTQRYTNSETTLDQVDWIYNVARDIDGNLTEDGRLHSVAKNTEWQEIYTYDSHGNVKNIDTSISGESIPFSRGFGFDYYGRLNKVTYPQGFVVRYGYDANTGTMVAVKNDTQSETYWSLTSEKANSSVAAYALGTAINVGADYYPVTGRLREIWAERTDVNSSEIIFDEGYGWDYEGNLKKFYDHTNYMSESYVYDNLHRLDTVTTNFDGSLSVADVDYDELGNIKSKTSVGSVFTYGGRNSSCDSSHANAGPHAVTSINSPTSAYYCYDNVGNMVKGDGLEIAYNGFNQPKTINKTTKSHTSTLAYDANQTLYKRIDTDGSTETTTVYVGGIYEKVTEGADVSHRFYIGDFAVMVRENDSDSIYYKLSNHLGSTSVTTDSLGIVQDRLSFDAWGMRRAPSGENVSDIYNWEASQEISDKGFTGHEQLDNVGLIHMGGRVYDPKIGRFLSADPIVGDMEDMQQYNAYSYVGNRPLSFIDPTGYVRNRPWILTTPEGYLSEPGEGIWWWRENGQLWIEICGCERDFHDSRGTNGVSPGVSSHYGDPGRPPYYAGGLGGAQAGAAEDYANRWNNYVSGVNQRADQTNQGVGNWIDGMWRQLESSSASLAELDRRFDQQMDRAQADGERGMADIGAAMAAQQHDTMIKITQIAIGANTAAVIQNSNQAHVPNSMVAVGAYNGGSWAASLPILPQGLVDAVAGFGDTLSFGLADGVRSLAGWNGSVVHDSSAYGYGVGGALGLSLAFGGAHLARNAVLQTGKIGGLGLGISRLFTDPRKWGSVRSMWSKAAGGGSAWLKANGQSLHHWLIPQRWGQVNAGFNYLPLTASFNSWMNGSTAFRSFVEWGFRGSVLGIYGAAPTAAIRD